MAAPLPLPAPGMRVTDDLRLVRELGSGGMSSVWVAEDVALGVDVAVKFLHPSSAATPGARLAREARLTATIDHPHAVKVIAYGDSSHGAPFIVMELIEGESLAARIARDGALPLRDVKQLVGQVAQVLSAAHGAGILHRDIKPANVMLVAGKGELFAKVVDFGIAKSMNDTETSALTLPGTMLGTPAYMAPEQLIDGRPADTQSDLWGLALIAYEALAGRPTFTIRTRAAIGAAMLLRRYDRVCSLMPELPPALDDWFERALSIDAHDRFESAIELAETFEEAASGAPPKSGTERRAPRAVELRIPDKLYGRDKEVTTVLRAFERASTGHSRILLVSGYSGIGKTSLIDEAHRTLAAGGATFVSGKFDQFDRATPYGSIVEAFRDLIAQTIARDAVTVAEWKTRPTAALLGDGGRALLGVWPELEALIGPQAELDAVSPEEARNRFQIGMGRLVASMATAERPLVVFLDDLQWADLASLDLVVSLATDPESRHVLLIGTYRDNEVDAAHPLTTALERLRSASAALDEITLGPLGEDAVIDLVSATFPSSPGRARFASLCHAKTRGNAFFLKRFLESLFEDGELRFDHDARRWTWDLAAVESRAMNENVVEFVAAEIKRMPAASRSVMEVAACIGDRFDLGTLAFVLGVERGKALDALGPGLLTELVVPAPEAPTKATSLDDGRQLTYRFAHDRIRQAARSSMDETTAVRVHKKVGRFLLDHLEGAERERRLFEIVDHLNRGLVGETTRSEATELRALNLSAARRATSSAAFAPAHHYFQRAWTLLAAEAWSSDYEQTLAIHLEGARAAYLSGDHATMESLVSAATSSARSPLDRVNAREVKIHALVSQQRFGDAVSLAVDVLGELGVKLPRDPLPKDVEREVVATLGLIEKLGPDDLGRLAMASDPTVVTVARIQNDVMSSAYMAAPNLLPIMACNIVRATLASGVCKESPYGFSIFGLVLNVINLIDVSHAMGKTAIEMLGRIDDRSVQPKTLHVVGTHVRPFVEPLRENVEAERRVFRLGMDTGDLEYAAWGLHCMVCNGFYAGFELAEVAKTYERNRSILLHHKQLPALGCTVAYGQTIANLTGIAADPTRLVGPDFDEASVMKELRAINFRGAAFILTTLGTYVRYLFGDLAGARAYADAGGDLADGAAATYHLVWWNQYRALAILGAVDVADGDAVSASLKAIEGNVAQLRTWHRFSAVNHDHRMHLVDAEIARVSGRSEDATRHYDEAIAKAAANGFTHEGALASELASRHHASLGSKTLARKHFEDACAAYERWGASAKVAQLRSRLA